ncbi:MAG: ABC transporter permease [Clostridia bacterium]|nr:ABC transporter permease [Clostridia bacterium]
MGALRILTVMFTLLKNDIKLFFKDWKALVILLVMPFFFISLFVYALSPYLNKAGFVEPFPIVLVDKEDTAQTRILVNQLKEITIFKEIIKTDEENARKLIDSNQAASAIIIPPEFSSSIAVGENKPVTVISNKSMPLQSFIVRNMMQSAANYVSAGQSAINTIYDYNRKAGVKGEELDKQFQDSTMRAFVEVLARNRIFTEIDAVPVYDLSPAEYYSSGLIVIFLMFAGMPGMKMLVSERNQGITRRLSAAPVKTWQVILSKFLISLILSILQFITIVLLTSMMFKSYWGAPIKNILLVFTGILFAVSAWSVFVSAIAKTPAAADVIGNLGILLMAVIGGSIYPLSSMPEFVRTLSNGTITKWAMEGFMILFSGNDAMKVTQQVTALMIIGMALFVLAVGAFKINRKQG